MGAVTSAEGVRSASSSVSAAETDLAYFDALYATSDDPWSMSTRWYEQRKRALLSAMLPRQRYARAFEPGCGNGLFTEVLAQRCDQIIASDVSERAVLASQRRLHIHPHVQISQGGLPTDIPAEKFDLIVIGELGYYFDGPSWMKVASSLRECLTEDGTLMACHWKAPFDERRLDTLTVHRTLNDSGGLHRQSLHDEPDFLVEVWTCSELSLAAQEGLR